MELGSSGKVMMRRWSRSNGINGGSGGKIVPRDWLTSPSEPFSANSTSRLLRLIEKVEGVES